MGVKLVWSQEVRLHLVGLGLYIHAKRHRAECVLQGEKQLFVSQTAAMALKPRTTLASLKQFRLL